MHSHQSYREVLVINNPSLFKSGFSDDMAISQIGFFSVNSLKDQTALAAPNFSVDKVIQIIQGTPEVAGGILGAIANASKRTKPIKGKNILSFKGAKPGRGQNQILTLGYDGVDSTKTLTARCEETRMVFVKLTGGPIDEAFHTEGRGMLRQYSIFSGCCDDCGDDCATINAEKMADDLVKQINSDPIFSLGSRTGNKLIKVTKVKNAAAPSASVTGDIWQLSIPDEGNDAALSRVQSQYSAYTVTRVATAGAISTYQFINAQADPDPASFTNSGAILIADCPTCPAGYTLHDTGHAYKVVKQDAGDTAALNAVATQYGIDNTEFISRVNYQFGYSTYVLVSDGALSSTSSVDEVQSVVATGASVGTFTLTFDGQTTAAIAFNAAASAVQTALEALSNVNPGDVVAAGGPLPTTPVTITFTGRLAGQNVPQMTANSGSLTGGTAVVSTTTAGVYGGGDLSDLGAVRETCVLTSPTTTAWVDAGDIYQYARTYSITLHDNVCGTSRLTELQAAFPLLTIVQASDDVDVDNTICSHKFTTVVNSDWQPAGCPPDAPNYVAPDAFQGIPWVAVPDSTSDVAVGVKFESAFVDRITNECAFDYWRYNSEPIYIEISQHSQDYNDKPTMCTTEWPITELQAAKIPTGTGSEVRELELEFNAYDREYRDENPLVREGQNAVLQADPSKSYDQYTLAFTFDYHQAWFTEKLTDEYRLELYFPEGTGKEFEAAMNGYISSIGIDLPPVVL